MSKSTAKALAFGAIAALTIVIGGLSVGILLPADVVVSVLTVSVLAGAVLAGAVWATNAIINDHFARKG